MTKLVEKMAAAGQLNAEQVERVGRNVADFMRACDADPELMKSANSALARPGFASTVRGALPQMAAGALIAGAAGAAQSLGGAAFGAVRDSIQRSRAYKQMMDANPQLASHDAKEVQRAFGTLHKFNPQYATDPSVAGAWVQNTLEGERLDIGALNQIVMARKNIHEATKTNRPDLTRFVQHQDPLAAARAQMQAENLPMERIQQRLQHARALEEASPDAFEYATGQPKPQAQYEFGKTR